MNNRTSDAAVGVHTLKCAVFGDMMESVDVSDSKSDGREVVWVRVPLSPPRGSESVELVSYATASDRETGF